MKPVVVDASVMIAAAEPKDAFHAESRKFPEIVITRGVAVRIPEFGLTELACALARRLRDPVVARKLAIGGLAAVRAVELPVDAALLAHATLSGTGDFLRGADTLCAAAAEMTGGVLVSWDGGHGSRAGALTPVEWMAANPK
jgi:predicted nucleic acid-binding protein